MSQASRQHGATALKTAIFRSFIICNQDNQIKNYKNGTRSMDVQNIGWKSSENKRRLQDNIKIDRRLFG